MRLVEKSEFAEIPEGVNVRVTGRKVTVEGSKGGITRDFSHAPVSISAVDGKVIVKTDWPRKKESAVVGAVRSHIKNMITGVTKGFTYKLKVVFSHFPISITVKGKTVIIENFTGERSSRKTRIRGEAKVRVKGDDVIVTGINIEDVAQTAANIEQATNIKNKDPRVFLDGIYVYEKIEGMEEN